MEINKKDVIGRPCLRCGKITPLKDFVVGFYTSNRCPKCRKEIGNDAIKRRVEEKAKRKAKFGY